MPVEVRWYREIESVTKVARTKTVFVEEMVEGFNGNPDVLKRLPKPQVVEDEIRAPKREWRTVWLPDGADDAAKLATSPGPEWKTIDA